MLVPSEGCNRQRFYVSSTPSVYTPPPSAAPSSESSNAYTSAMPYSSFMSGGYKSLNCGYGYSKDSNGACQPESCPQLGTKPKAGTHKHKLVSDRSNRNRIASPTMSAPVLYFSVLIYQITPLHHLLSPLVIVIFTINGAG